MILKEVSLGVEKDLSGGIKIRLGSSMGVLSPEQAVEFAAVLLKVAGVDVNFTGGMPPPRQRHFETN